MAVYKSRHGTVLKSPAELYMGFVDMRNFLAMIPEDKRSGVEADYDHIKASVQGFTVGAKVVHRFPYSQIDLEDDGAPFRFSLKFHFDAAGEPFKTDFSIELDADLNFMMKMLIGNKIQEALDKVVDGLVAVSEGRVPEGVDPEMFKNGFPS